MKRKKKPQADVRRWYHLYLELGLVVALALLIGAFRMHFNPETQLDVQLQEQEVIALDELPQTRQMDRPPPPPRPPAPVEVPDDVVLEEDAIEFDAEIDFSEPIDIPPPPPPPVRKKEEVVEEEPEIFIVVEQMPELIGGIQSIQKHLSYPEIAKRAGVEGMVVVQFVVNEEGRPIDPVVIRSLGGGCDEEAVRVIMEHATFVPGKQRGKPVRVRFSIPVRFVLMR